MGDGFDAQPAAPNDFPGDPVIHHHLLAWLILLVLAVAVTVTLTLAYKSAEKMVRGRLGDGVDARVKAVRAALEAAAWAQSGDQYDRARKARAALDDNFGHTLALGTELSKVVNRLNGALEGTREEEIKPKTPAPSGSVAQGGTVINIAIANGAPNGGAPAAEVGPSAAPAAKPAKDETPPKPVTAEEQSDSLWRAVQKLFAYWDNMNVVNAAFRAAQQQLLQSPVWVAPPEEGAWGAPAGRFGRPGKDPTGGSGRSRDGRGLR